MGGFRVCGVRVEVRIGDPKGIKAAYGFWKEGWKTRLQNSRAQESDSHLKSPKSKPQSLHPKPQSLDPKPKSLDPKYPKI